jgi:hypothetical protein
MELAGRTRWCARASIRRPPVQLVCTAAAGGRHSAATRAAGSSSPSRWAADGFSPFPFFLVVSGTVIRLALCSPSAAGGALVAGRCGGAPRLANAGAAPSLGARIAGCGDSVRLASHERPAMSRCFTGSSPELVSGTGNLGLGRPSGGRSRVRFSRSLSNMRLQLSGRARWPAFAFGGGRSALRSRPQASRRAAARCIVAARAAGS